MAGPARHPRWVRRLLGEAGPAAVVDAIARAERATSGEIRVHLERRLPRRAAGDPLRRAREVFAALGMTATAARNGVLIYLAVDDRRLAVVGDEGIHARAGDAAWARVRDLMVERLRAGRVLDALLAGIEEVGRVLAAHFPRRPADVDELPDDLSVGDGASADDRAPG